MDNFTSVSCIILNEVKKQLRFKRRAGGVGALVLTISHQFLVLI